MSNVIIKVISDTHRAHLDLTDHLAGADLVIHAGDADCYDQKTFDTFLNWAAKVAKTTKYGFVFVPGNHDIYIAEEIDYIRDEFVGANVHILVNEEIRIAGLNIYGSPNSIAYGDRWTAFAGNEYELTNRSWTKIPSNLDILITHSPPAGVLDSGHGSEGLAAKILEVRPRVHIFGHIHHAAGVTEENGTVFVNAVTVGGQIYQPIHLTPFNIEYDAKNREVLSVERS